MQTTRLRPATLRPDRRGRGQSRGSRAPPPEKGVIDRVDDATGGSAGDGVPPEGRAVIARGEPFSDLVGDEEDANGKSVREPLCEGDEVGSRAELLEREEGARTTDPRLDFVEAEKRRERCRGCDELALERDHAAFAENRLEENDPDVVLGSAHESVDVVRRNEAHSRYERRERLSLPRLPRRRKGTERPPVEASLERDDT